jgi:hypothetical protein
MTNRSNDEPHDTEPAPPVDRAAITLRISTGSFMAFATRAHVLRAALEPCLPRTRDTARVLEALQSEIDAVLLECARWPDDLPKDPTERLAWSRAMEIRVTALEDRARNFLEGGR